MDNGSVDEGKPPKKPKDIRAALQSIQREYGSEIRQGPLAEGPGAGHDIVIASFYDSEVARSYQRQLSQAGIVSRSTLRARVTEISVDYEDHQRASALFDQHRATCPDRRPRGIRRDYDYLIFGIAIGSALGFVYAFNNLRSAAAVAAPAAFALTGALTGHLIDRVRGHWRRFGRFRLGIWELMILAVLPALLAFILTLMPRLLR